MKILIKHVNNLMSDNLPDGELIPQYLVYLMTNDDIAVTCNIASGDIEKDEIVDKINGVYNVDDNENFTLDIKFIDYLEHNKQQNKY